MDWAKLVLKVVVEKFGITMAELDAITISCSSSGEGEIVIESSDSSEMGHFCESTVDPIRTRYATNWFAFGKRNLSTSAYVIAQDKLPSDGVSKFGDATSSDGFIYVYLFDEEDGLCNDYDADSESEESYDRPNRMGYIHMDYSNTCTFDIEHVPCVMSRLSVIEVMMISGLNGIIEEVD